MNNNYSNKRKIFSRNIMEKYSNNKHIASSEKNKYHHSKIAQESFDLFKNVTDFSM